MCSQAYRACVLSCFSCVQFCATLQVACPSPGDLPYPGIEPAPLTSLTLAGEFFTISITWEATWTKMGGRSMDCSISPSCTTHISLLIPSLLRHLLTCWPFSMSLSISGVIKSLREWLAVRRRVDALYIGFKINVLSCLSQSYWPELPWFVFGPIVPWSEITASYMARSILMLLQCLDPHVCLPALPYLHFKQECKSTAKPEAREVTLFFFPGSLLICFQQNQRALEDKKKKIFKISPCLYISGKVVIPPRRDAEPWASDLGLHRRTCLPAASLSLLASASSSPAESLPWAPPRGWKRQDGRRNRLTEVPAGQIGEEGEMRGEVKAGTGALLT